MAAPAFEMASMAYSTWYNRPSGLKIVVLESYRLAIPSLCCGPDHFINVLVRGADGLNTLSCKSKDVFALLYSLMRDGKRCRGVILLVMASLAWKPCRPRA